MYRTSLSAIVFQVPLTTFELPTPAVSTKEVSVTEYVPSSDMMKGFVYDEGVRR